MNRSVFHNLPRFDGADDVFEDLLDTDQTAGQHQTLPEAEEATPLEPAPEPQPHWRDEVHDAMREALVSFDTATRDVPAKMQQQAHEAVLTFLGDLFPKLSELFLAEEIARHLPDLLPTSKADIQIKAAPDIATELEEITLLNDFPTTDYSIVSEPKFRLGQVEISWASGGFSYDFSDRLERSLEQLRQLAAKSED